MIRDYLKFKCDDFCHEEFLTLTVKHINCSNSEDSLNWNLQQITFWKYSIAILKTFWIFSVLKQDLKVCTL